MRNKKTYKPLATSMNSAVQIDVLKKHRGRIDGFFSHFSIIYIKKWKCPSMCWASDLIVWSSFFYRIQYLCRHFAQLLWKCVEYKCFAMLPVHTVMIDCLLMLCISIQQMLVRYVPPASGQMPFILWLWPRAVAKAHTNTPIFTFTFKKKTFNEIVNNFSDQLLMLWTSI